ncbi:hypothetical protein EV182_002243 [Spiromyces aspiralis]|uniref:Uncharacterized protein n=1 Tax=Spiromyces aspiralis TaxID=68401 RepID=A0ACC1HKY1_9FUNG|nr:hypothetical protein EV182_002243 [Spiromyces aspiralis]
MTEREHQDYFFHERNRVHLALLLNNLYMSCSWLPNRSEELEPSIMRVRKALEDYQRGDRNFPLSDVKLLGRCIEAMESAVNDPLWNYLMTSQDLGYWVDNFPPEELEGVPKGLVSPNHAEDRTAVVPDLIYRLQGRVKAHLAATASDAKSGAGANGPGAPLPPSPSTSGGIDKAANTQPVLDWYKRARVMGSTSTKFGYLLSQILRHHKTEKCVVFTQNQNDMYFIYHALKILRVPALYYYKGKDTNDAKRSQIITTFNTSQIYSVILMDTRLAAFGINLTAASRIWFFSPVWQTSTERQAIKRAHRIGQARTVFVETLVTKGSIEEAMVARRREISRNHEHTITKSMEDDSKMRQMIHQADFISLSSCCYSTDGLSAPQDPCSECARTGPWTTGHVKWGEPIDPSIPVVDPRLHTAALAAGRCGAYGDLQRGHTTHKCVDHNRGPLVDISAARPPAPVMRSPLASPNGPEASIRHHTITKEEASNRATSSPKRKVTFAATSPTPTKRSPLRRIRLKVPDEGKSDSKKALNTRSHSTRIGITAHEQRQYGGAAPTSHQRYCNVECTAPYGTLAVNIKSGDSEPSAPYPADYLTDSSRETTAAKPVGGCVSEPRSLDSFPIKRQLLTSYTGPSSLSTFSTNPDSTMPPKKRVKKAVTFNI